VPGAAAGRGALREGATALVARMMARRGAGAGAEFFVPRQRNVTLSSAGRMHTLCMGSASRKATPSDLARSDVAWMKRIDGRTRCVLGKQKWLLGEATLHCSSSSPC